MSEFKNSVANHAPLALRISLPTPLLFQHCCGGVAICHPSSRVSSYENYSRIFDKGLVGETGVYASLANRTEMDIPIEGLELRVAPVILHAVLREGRRVH